MAWGRVGSEFGSGRVWVRVRYRVRVGVRVGFAPAICAPM